VRKEIVELGRACVHRQHRNLVVLGLLWKGIAAYAKERGGRYLIGCSSLTSQDPVVGTAAYQELGRKNLAPAPGAPSRCRPTHVRLTPGRRTRGHPQAAARLPDHRRKNLRPPAMDRQFKTMIFSPCSTSRRFPRPRGCVFSVDRYPELLP